MVLSVDVVNTVVCIRSCYYDIAHFIYLHFGLSVLLVYQVCNVHLDYLNSVFWQGIKTRSWLFWDMFILVVVDVQKGLK